MRDIADERFDTSASPSGLVRALCRRMVTVGGVLDAGRDGSEGELGSVRCASRGDSGIVLFKVERSE